jgi:hypothetical protein
MWHKILILFTYGATFNGQGFDSLTNKIIRRQFIYLNTTSELKLSCLNQCKINKTCGIVGIITIDTSNVVCQFSGIPRIALLTHSYRYIDNAERSEIYFTSSDSLVDGWMSGVAYFPLDNLMNGTNIIPTSGSSKSFESVTFSTTPQFSCSNQQQLSFLKILGSSGVTDYQIIFNNSLTIDFNIGFSISVWFNPASPSSYLPLIESYTDSAHTSRGFYIWIQGTSGQGIHTLLGDDRYWNSNKFNNFGIGQWHHVIMAANKSHATLYGNGSWIMTQPLVVSANMLYGHSVQIGRRNWPGDGANGMQFGGCIANLGFFNRYISLSEANTIYNWVWIK